FFFSSRRRHTISKRDWSSDVCSSDLKGFPNQYGDPFPASICTSVNDQVVHGIPGDDVVLKDGDIVSVDCGTYMNGFCGDSAYTFCVGEVDEEVRKLVKVTKEALHIAIQNAV